MFTPGNFEDFFWNKTQDGEQDAWSLTINIGNDDGQTSSTEVGEEPEESRL